MVDNRIQIARELRALREKHGRPSKLRTKVPGLKLWLLGMKVYMNSEGCNGRQHK